MKHFKLKQGLTKVYPIEEKTFEKETGNQRPYCLKGADGIVRHFGICPICDNPIQLVGMYVKEKKISPYGKHYNRSTEIAPHDETAYLYCPYSIKTYSYSGKVLKEKETDFEKNIYRTAREYFDLAMYILQQDTGIVVTEKLARTFLQSYKGAQFHRYYKAAPYNIPWMFLYAGQAIPCYGLLVVEDSLIYSMLKKQKEVFLRKYNSFYVVDKADKWLDLNLSMILHNRSVVADELVESISLCLSSTENGLPKILDQEKIPINERRFPNLVNSPHAIRKEKLINLAKEILPGMEEHVCRI